MLGVLSYEYYPNIAGSVTFLEERARVIENGITYNRRLGITLFIPATYEISFYYSDLSYNTNRMLMIFR